MSDLELLQCVQNLKKDVVRQMKQGISSFPASTKAVLDAVEAPKSVAKNVSAPKEAPVSSFEQIKEKALNCQKCVLAQTRTKVVFGKGNINADLMFVGEAPGFDEDVQGEPFVGLAGQLLTKIIQAMGFTREEIYIANVLKCRPPNNRSPKPEEIEQCQPYLQAQVEQVKPKVIVALGTFAAQTLLKTDRRISSLRGFFHDYEGVQLMPTYHPAYLLRSPSEKKSVWEDMKVVMKALNKSLPESPKR